MGYAVVVAVPVIVVLVMAGVIYFLAPIQVHLEEEAVVVLEKGDIEVFGDGPVLVQFQVEIPEWTPPEDRIYVYVDGFHNGPGGGIPMKLINGSLTAQFRTGPDQVLRYKYNRNDFGFATDEEFSPDSESSRRRLDLKSGKVLVKDEVKKWRWLREEIPNVRIFPDEPETLPYREDDFVVGIALLDFYQGRFDYYVPFTLDRIKENGFEYVAIAYSPATIMNGEGLRFYDGPINTFSEEELDAIISEARKRDLKIMLMVGMEVNPENLQKIDSEMSQVHDDDWYVRLFVKWEDAMVNAARFAEDRDIEILSVSNQWPFWGYQTDEQKVMLNGMINGAFQKLQAIHSGKLTSDFYLEDEHYDYYRQMDWVGDKWWWPVASTQRTIIEDMRSNSKEIIEEVYRPIHEKYHKPIFLNQLAYASFDGGAGGVQISTEDPLIAEWFPYDNTYPEDFREQADAYEAVFRAIQDEPMFTGAFSFGYGYWDLQDKSVGIRSKPAEKVWMKWNNVFLNETKK